MSGVEKPTRGDDWLAVTDEVLPVAVAYEWAVSPECGGVVLFSGTVRDHAEGRPGVTALEYEAYSEMAEAEMRRIGIEMVRKHSLHGIAMSSPSPAQQSSPLTPRRVQSIATPVARSISIVFIVD